MNRRRTAAALALLVFLLPLPLPLSAAGTAVAAGPPAASASASSDVRVVRTEPPFPTGSFTVGQQTLHLVGLLDGPGPQAAEVRFHAP